MSATSKRDRAIRDGLEPATGKDHPDRNPAPVVSEPEPIEEFDPTEVEDDEQS